MATVTVSKNVNASLQEVWQSWENFGDIYKFNPSLKHSYLLSDEGKPTGVGSERQCDLADNKNWLRERIVEYRPMNSLKVDIYESSMPMKSMTASFRFREVSDGKTSVQMTVVFEPGMGVVGKLMTPLMKRQFRPMLQSLLDCNAAHVEHGETVPSAA